MRVKPTALTICGPYKGEGARPLIYHVKAVFDMGGKMIYSAPLTTVGKRSFAIKRARSIRGQKKWGKVPIYMRWSFAQHSLERVDETTHLTERQVA